ncbi:MAG: 60S ribosomal protein L17 [Bathelium mastoideum]|nr:MAG: 60S ribosomal protein L17 [Bathelium mastoideum]
MARFAATEAEPDKSARARGSHLHVSFRNTRETAQAINGWKVSRALTYLENGKQHKEAVPMRRYAGSAGRTAQGKQFGIIKARWPVKSANFLLSLLKNAVSNADTRGLDTSNLVVKHIRAGADFLLSLMKKAKDNTEANTDIKGLDTNDLVVKHA